jgi:hypothetical protein
MSFLKNNKILYFNRFAINGDYIINNYQIIYQEIIRLAIINSCSDIYFEINDGSYENDIVDNIKCLFVSKKEKTCFYWDDVHNKYVTEKTDNTINYHSVKTCGKSTYKIIV